MATSSRRLRTPVLVNTDFRWSCTVCSATMQTRRDLTGREAAADEAGHRPLARGETVGRHQQRRDLARGRGLDDHRGGLACLQAEPGRVDHDPAAGSGSHPQARRWGVRVDGAAQLGDDGVQLDRQQAIGCRVAQLVEPDIRRPVAADERAVIREQDETRCVRALHDRVPHEQAEPDPLRQVRGDASDEPGLRRREAVRPLTVEAHVAPARPAGAQRDAQLVGQPERPEDVAVARAPLEISSGRLDQRAHASRANARGLSTCSRRRPGTRSARSTDRSPRADRRGAPV